MMYIYFMETYMTDEEIKREIRRRKNRESVKKRIIIAGICCIFAIILGIFVGNAIGTTKYRSEVAIKTPVAADTPFINKALSQIGNEGGEKFWKWFGFGSYQPWCACFASWCLDSQGYIDDGFAPRFAMVSDGANWFKNQDQWQDAGTTPVAGDLIFFDWEGDDVMDHVGIVTGVVGDNVYTIEGNSSDRCRQKRYKLTSPVIVGYGHMSL